MTLPLATIAAKVMTLPITTFPRTLDKLRALLADGEVPTPVISAVLASDPVLSAALLGRANASAPSEPTRVAHAAVVLGTATVQGIVEAARPLDPALNKVMAELYGLANATATMCHILGETSRVAAIAGVDSETLHSIGLIHDLGSIAACSLFPAAVAEAAHHASDGSRSFHDALQTALGATPALLGAIWAHHLSLPPLVVRSLHHQEDPLQAEGEIAGALLIHIARNLVKGAGFACTHDPFVEPISLECLDRLGLETADLARALDRFFAESDELELYEGALLFRAS